MALEADSLQVETDAASTLAAGFILTHRTLK